MSGELPDVGAFGALFTDFARAMHEAAERPEPALRTRLREHLGADPRELPTTVAEFPTTDHANLQLALDAVLPGAERLGFLAPHSGMMGVALSDLIAGHGPTGNVTLGPVQYTDVEVGDGRAVECIAFGL